MYTSSIPGTIVKRVGARVVSSGTAGCRRSFRTSYVSRFLFVARVLPHRVESTRSRSCRLLTHTTLPSTIVTPKKISRDANVGRGFLRFLYFLHFLLLNSRRFVWFLCWRRARVGRAHSYTLEDCVRRCSRIGDCLPRGPCAPGTRNFGKDEL